MILSYLRKLRESLQVGRRNTVRYSCAYNMTEDEMLNRSKNTKSGFYTATLHAEKSFRNFINSNRNQIVFTMHRLIWNLTEVRLVPNQSRKGKYNLISVWFDKISKIFLCVWMISSRENSLPASRSSRRYIE